MSGEKEIARRVSGVSELIEFVKAQDTNPI